MVVCVRILAIICRDRRVNLQAPGTPSKMWVGLIHIGKDVHTLDGGPLDNGKVQGTPQMQPRYHLPATSFSKLGKASEGQIINDPMLASAVSSI